jgi:hypothetical protein
MGFVEEPTAIESKDVLTVYLAKYGTLRAETSSRFQFQAQAFNFLVVVLTAGVVASNTLIGGELGGQFNRLVLILPLVAGPLGYLLRASTTLAPAAAPRWRRSPIAAGSCSSCRRWPPSST